MAVGELYTKQPLSCRLALPKKEIIFPQGWWKHTPEEEKKERINKWLRVMFLEPTEIYKRIGHKLDPFKRTNYVISRSEVFPDTETKECPCGCGREREQYKYGGYKTYATDQCSGFCFSVMRIIAGDCEMARKFLHLYYGHSCTDCVEPGTDVDHVVAVQNGGGACWLSNYQLRCHTCHVKKTRKDHWDRKQQIPLF